MKTVFWAAGALCAVVLALAPAAASAPASPIVVGSGEADLWWGSTRFTVHAFGTGSGVEARGLLRLTFPAGWSQVDVRCINPVGGRVLVGGIIVEDANPAAIGRGTLIVIEDGAATRASDKIGIAFGPTAAASCAVDVLDAISRYDALYAGNLVLLGLG